MESTMKRLQTQQHFHRIDKKSVLKKTILAD